MNNIKGILPIIILICAALPFFMGNRSHNTYQAKLAGLSMKDIRSARISLWTCTNDNPIQMDKSDYDTLAKYLSQFTPAVYLGMRGPWDTKRAIELDADKIGNFRIILTTRKSLNGHVLASVHMLGDDQYYTEYYDANDLWNWLKERPAVIQQEKSFTGCGK